MHICEVYKLLRVLPSMADYVDQKFGHVIR